MATEAAYQTALKRALTRDVSAVKRGLAALRRDHDDLIAEVSERLDELQPRLAAESARRDYARRVALGKVRASGR